MACPAPSSPPPPSPHFPSTHPLQIPTTRLNPKPDLIYFRRHRRRPPSPSPSTSMSNPKPSDPQQHSADFIFSVKSPKSDVRTPSCNRPKAPVDRVEYIIALPAVIPAGVAVDSQASGKSNNVLQKRDSRGRFEKEENGVCSDKAIVDCSSGLGNGSAVKRSRVDNRLVEKLPRRFTRSAGRKKKEEETLVEEKEMRLVAWLTDSKGRIEKEVSNRRSGNGSAGKQSKLARGDGRSTRKGRFEKEVSNRQLGNGSAGKQSKLARGDGRSARKRKGNVGEEKATRLVARLSLKAPTFADDQREVAGTSIVIFQEENLVEIPIIFDNWDKVDVGDGQLDESIRAVYEGFVTVNLATEFDKGHGVLLEDFTNTPITKRRCTRSLVKGAIEESAAADALALTVVNSVQLDESEGDNAGLSGSLSMMLKKKMELKMSKKITLTKLPSTIKDLLGTGLLEGLLVTYNSCPGKKVGLQGVIRGTGILCSCTSCRGATVVSIYQFEVHAGSTNKHPSNFIFFQNGKNLREVLRSCIGVSLDMLEAVIQNAIGPLSTKKLSVCEKCKGTGTFSLLCNLCVERNHQQGIPTASNGPSSCHTLPGRILVPFVSDGTPMYSSPLQKLTYGKLTRKDLGLHKLVFMDGILPQGTEVGYYLHGKRLLEGYIKDSGIFCRCCSNVLSPSQFEAHAGQASRRKPYNNIYTSNGVSLHELSVSLSKGRRLSSTENDDLCRICADGGDLLLCDLCPRAFHKECVGLSSIPIGDWFCPYCQILHQKDKCFANDDNAIAAGRVTGVDPIEQIIKRCIRIVSAPENDAGVCALCRQHDFRRSGFDRRTVIICDQCEIEYHVGCLKDHGMADLKELPEGEWFCRPDCRSIHSTLHELLRQGPEVFQELDANIIWAKHGEIGLDKDASADVRWRLLSGRSDHADSKLLLSQAISIFRESFDPIIDPISGRDLMPFMVYGKNMRRQDYGGVYCMVLTLKSSVISAALLRVLGCEIAELPLVATKRDMQGLGYFQALFACIERLLKSLKVKHFVLPAADDTESMWINKFGFAKLMRTELLEHAKNAQPIIFQGASILHKLVGASASG